MTVSRLLAGLMVGGCFHSLRSLRKDRGRNGILSCKSDGGSRDCIMDALDLPSADHI